MAQATRIVIEARGLKKQFENVLAVKDLSFHVLEGECFGLLGPNGAGKSTTMRMLNCVSQPNEGDLFVLGLDAKNQTQRIQHQVGVVPQEDGLDPDFSAFDNLYIYARYFGIARREAKKRAQELLRLMNLEDEQDKGVYEMSGGQRRRLTLARGLINEPALIMLDEPTTGLDPQIRHFVWEYLEGLKLKGKTLILTTHYMEEAERLCDRVAIMDKGEILAIGTPREMIETYVGQEVVEFVCRPSEIDYYLSKYRETYEYQVLNNKVRLFIKEGDNPKSIMEGIDSEMITLRRASLEDVFLKLAGYKLSN